MLRLLARLFGRQRPAPVAGMLAEPLERRLMLTRLAVIGDYSTNNSTQPLQQVSQLINSWSPDAVVTDSDNNYPDGAADTIDANVGQWFHQYIYPYKGSYGAGAADNQNHFWPSPGDHDWGTGSLQPYLNYFTLPNNGRYYTTQVGNIAIFSIDAEPQEPDGMSSTSTQANWIKSQMLASTATWKLVVFADPAYSSGFFLGDSTMRWPFASWGATAVISGHAHDYERLTEGGLTYFVDGLGGESNDPFQTPQTGSLVRYNSDFGALRVDSTSTSITFTFVTRAGQTIDTYTINSGFTNSQPVYVPLGSTWKYLDNGSNQGTAWQSPTFNDSSWSSGPAELGFGDGSENTTTNQHITTYFRTSFNVADPTTVQALTLNLIEDQGAVVYLNGTEVYRNDMPSGTIAYTTLASSDINPGSDDYWLAGTAITAPIVAGNNVLAVELHLPSANASDLSFDLQLSATLGQPTIPAAPTNLQATISPSQIALSWSASGGATSYKVYRGTTPGGEGSTPLATNVTTTSYTDTAVTTGITYYYQVSAVNNLGESARSGEISAGIKPPPTPTGLQASGGISQIALSWGESSGASTYNVYRSTSSGAEGSIPFATNIAATSFTDTAVTAGSTYYYQVTAVNAIGESAKSTEVSATVVATPAHVVVVVESHFGSGIVGSSSAPYINSLVSGGAMFNNASGITYPAQPNYLALFSGSTQSVTSDTVPSSQFSTANLGSELIAAGLTFTGYAEGLPSAGSLVNTSGSNDSAGNAPYQRYHNPWSDFSNVPSADNQPFTAFPTTFTSLPSVSFVVPNMTDDFHDGTVSQADTWLQTNLGAYATWATTHNSLLIVTWDDNVSGSNPNQIDTIIYGQQVKTGTYADAITHYNVLRTIEDLYGVTRLGSAATASTIQDAWHTVPLSPPVPTALQATSGGTQQINLTWTASTGANSYNVYRGTTPGGENATPVATNVTTASYNDTGLTPGVTYYYQVTAVNGSGESARSTEANAATQKATPALSGLSASPTIIYGTATTTLSGTISAGTLIPTGNVTITINGSPANAAINASTGAFSANFDTHAIPASATAYTITYSFASNANYNAASDTSTTLTVNQRALTVTATGINKTYDGGTAATVTLSDNRVNSDSLTIAYASAAFVDKNVGTGKSVSVSGIGLSGGAAGNYSLGNTTASTTANITARTLSVTATGVNKTYDGTTASSVNLGDNRVSGDAFTDSSTSATFATKNVGNNKTVSVSGISISGTDAGDYTLSATTASTNANITQRTLTVTASGVNKTYDGTTTAAVVLSDNRVSGDVLTDNSTASTFSDKNVGTGKAVSISGISISGTDSGNYTLTNTTASTTANITVRSLTVSATGVNRTYDGTTAASVTLSDNRVSGDVLSDAYTSASFADKNVATSKTVSVSGISVSGTDLGNYTLTNTSASTTANISARSLTVSAAGVNKVYDGTTAATVTLSDNRLAGDTLSDSYTTAAFSDKNVGTGKVVTVSGISASGADAGNYTFNTTATTAANITQRTLTISASGITKVYDGTTAATVTLSDNRITGDTLSDSYTTATFADKNVGTIKTVSASGLGIGGTDSGNYTLTNTTASTTANITARSLTVSAAGINKVYDGTTAASVTLSDNRVSGDTLTDSYSTATFTNKNVGTGKSVSVGGIAVAGVDSGNYTFNATATTIANITPMALTVAAAGVNKVYDGTTTGSVTLSDNRAGGDTLTDSYTSATFADKNVGVNKNVSVSGISISGADAGNYAFNTTAGTTASITVRSLTVTASGVNKIYDGSTVAAVGLSDNRLSGDTLTYSYSSAAFSDKNVGTNKTVTVNGLSIGGTDSGNYTLTNTVANTVANITARSLTVSATAANKIYDGTTTATITLSDNHVSGDSVTDGYTTATFANKSVANGKTVTVSGISISGTDAGNYTANTTATTTANITPLALTVTATGVNKVYNGTTAATVTLSDNRISGDVFTDGFTTATFSDKNVGTGKTISVSGISLSGTDAANYTFNPTATTTANITPLALTLGGSNKVYDGTTAATVALANAVGGDNVTLAYTSAVFSDKNVANGKTVTVSGISLGGTDAGNYSIGTSGSATANITPLALTVSAAGTNKTYDGTTAAVVTLSDNRISGDVFSDTYTSATFNDKNVGTNKTVTVSGISIGGTDAGNYTFNTTATAAANITARTLTVSAAATNKTYDGTTTASVALSDNRVSGDNLSETFATATFSDKNVGNGKTVSVSGISISGTDAGNYTFNTTASTTANVTPFALTVSAAGTNKTYDGTIVATVTLSDNRIGGDVFSDSYASATFANKSVANGKTVSVSGISISGTDAGNYTANATATTTANITPLALTVSATGVNKTYDGTTTTTITLSDNHISGDSITDSYATATFANKSVANGKTVTVSGISISGTDAGNYTANTTATTTANITPLALTVSATGVNKVYNGTLAATVTLSDNRISGDAFTDGFTTATFSDKNVGNGKTVSVSGISISGTDAGNYTFNTTASTTANVTPFALTVSAAGTNKTYDGTTAATVTLSDNRINGDVFSDTYTSATFSDKNVGTSKTIAVSGISIGGTDAANYTFNSSATAAANITPLPLVITVNGQGKIYDGTTIATVSLSDNRIAGDTLTVTYTAANFADKNAATGKTITVSGITVTGPDAPNYSFAATASGTADITPRLLDVTATAQSKPYDGTTAAVVGLSDDRLAGDSIVVSYAGANFFDKNVGNLKTVNISGLAISGPDAGNYSLGASASVATTANITPELVITAADATDSITLVQDADQAHVDWFLNGTSLLGQLAISDAAGLTINASGASDSIVLDNSHGSPIPSSLHLNGTFTMTGLSGTNPLAGVNLDLNRSTLFISYNGAGNDPLALIQQYLRNAFNGGAWNGVATALTGVITSSAAAGNAAQTTAIGYVDSADALIPGQPANTIELRYSLYGDTSLSGSVGFSDFTRLTQHYGQTAGGTWDTGDFNYDGSVNFADFTLMSRTYNTSLGSQASPAASPATAAAGATAATSAAAAPSTSSSPASSQPSVQLPTKTHKRPLDPQVKPATKAAARPDAASHIRSRKRRADR